MTLKMQFAISGPTREIHNVRQSNVRDDEVFMFRTEICELLANT